MSQPTQMARANSLETSIGALPVLAVLLMVLALPLRASDKRDEGRELFARCAACHLQDGKGVPGTFPPLAGRLGPLIGLPQGREYLVLVVQAGLVGELEIEGSQYRGVMPAQGAELGDKGVAAVLNYMLKQFNARTLPATWRPFSAEEVSLVKARYPSTTAVQLHQMRAEVFAALKK